MTTKHFVDEAGNYIGGYGDGAVPPAGSVEVFVSPPHGSATWDGTVWFFSDEAAASIVRMERDLLLVSVVDVVSLNPLRWNSLSPAEQEAFSTYRKALLDIPTQSGFPHQVVWPNKPE